MARRASQVSRTGWLRWSASFPKRSTCLSAYSGTSPALLKCWATSSRWWRKPTVRDPIDKPTGHIIMTMGPNRTWVAHYDDDDRYRGFGIGTTPQEARDGLRAAEEEWIISGRPAL